MDTSPDRDMQVYFETYLHSLFQLSSGKITWQGESEFDAETPLYYFSIDDAEYLLLQEVYADKNAFGADGLIGNVVAPHQRLTHVRPKDGSLPYVRIQGEDSTVASYRSGYFSIFRITG